MMSGRDGRAEEVEGEAGGSRHTQCTFMEMHCNFCLTILLFCFSKNVCVLSVLLPPFAFFSVPIS